MDTPKISVFNFRNSSHRSLKAVISAKEIIEADANDAISKPQFEYKAVIESSLRLTSGANKCEVQWVEEENNIFLSYVLREFNLQQNNSEQLKKYQ